MKNIALLLLFTFSFTTAFAQLGIKAGVNFSNIATDEDNIEDLEAKIGFQAGVALKLKLTEQVAIQPEALYTRKGAKYNFLGADVTSNMDYLDIPVLLVIQPFDIPLQIQLGPQFSYLLRTEVTYENGLFTSQSTYKADREDFEDFDYGLAAGIVFNFGNTFLDLRYTRGLKKYEKESSVGTVTIKPESKHFNLEASVGVFF